MDGLRKKKILFVLGGLYCGGTESVVMNIFRKIDKEKFQIDFLIHEKNPSFYDQEVLSLGGEIHRIPDRTEVGIVNYFKNLISILRQISPDVVHSHAMFNSGAVMVAAFLIGIRKRITHSHNTSDQSGNNIIRMIFRLLMRFLILIFSSELLACSLEAERFLYGRWTSIYKRTHILNNAIDTKQFGFNQLVRNKVRKNLGLNEKLVIGHIGRFDKQKNHEYLIEVFNCIHEKNPKANLLLIGEGPLKPVIEKKVKESGLERAVQFLGNRNDISHLLQGMDLLLFPSLYEGFPVVLTEAQGSGLTCFVSDTITKDTNITGLVKFLNIKVNPKEWALKILASDYSHVDTSEKLKKAGYDTNTNTKVLEDIYKGTRYKTPKLNLFNKYKRDGNYE